MKDAIEILNKAGVPAAYHEQALASMKDAESRSKSVRKYKWRAPFVMLPVCYKLPWEAEVLPEKYRPYDNNISINGDQGIWATREDGVPYRLPIPLDIKGNSNNDWGNPYNYYAPKKLSARHWFARYIWLGLRNKACKAADDAGYLVPEGTQVLEWNQKNSDEEYHVHYIPTMNLWQLSMTKKRFGFIHFRKNLGFKIGNLNPIDRIASVIWIPFSFKLRSRDVS